jgi:hypothetical protein
MPAKRYKVTLADEERQNLLALISKGKAAAHTLARARILLPADQGPQGPAWSDEQIQPALHVGRLTVERTRQAVVEHGMDAALNRQQRATPGNQKVDGHKEAPLLAIAGSTPPQGQKRGTVKLVANNMVAREHVDSMTPETRRQHRKKMHFRLG